MKYYYKETPKIRIINNLICRLEYDWCFYDNKGNQYWIPAKYLSDGASIPKLVQPIMGSPFQSNLTAGYLAHDWIYLTHILERDIADEILFQLARQEGTPHIKATTIWSAVRCFGAMAYKNDVDDLMVLELIKEKLALRNDKDKFRI